MKRYAVYYHRDETDEQYLGEAATLRECRRMATQHHRGRHPGLTPDLYREVLDGKACFGLPAWPLVLKGEKAVAQFGHSGAYSAIQLWGLKYRNKK